MCKDDLRSTVERRELGQRLRVQHAQLRTGFQKAHKATVRREHSEDNDDDDELCEEYAVINAAAALGGAAAGGTFVHPEQYTRRVSSVRVHLFFEFLLCL